jgi:hypothetical protein
VLELEVLELEALELAVVASVVEVADVVQHKRACS